MEPHSLLSVNEEASQPSFQGEAETLFYGYIDNNNVVIHRVKSFPKVDERQDHGNVTFVEAAVYKVKKSLTTVSSGT